MSAKTRARELHQFHSPRQLFSYYAKIASPSSIRISYQQNGLSATIEQHHNETVEFHNYSITHPHDCSIRLGKRFSRNNYIKPQKYENRKKTDITSSNSLPFDYSFFETFIT